MHDPALDESVQTLGAGFAFGRLLRPQICTNKFNNERIYWESLNIQLDTLLRQVSRLTPRCFSSIGGEYPLYFIAVVENTLEVLEGAKGNRPVGGNQKPNNPQTRQYCHTLQTRPTKLRYIPPHRVR
jgi:hypothetical protein